MAVQPASYHKNAASASLPSSRPNPPRKPPHLLASSTVYADPASPQFADPRPSPVQPASASASTPHIPTTVASISDHVASCRGHTPITSVLIANNGMAAVKAIRSIRKWSYETFGDEAAVRFTAMCTPEDLHVNAEFVRMADRYVEVPGGTANNNYANVDLIVDIAERTGTHAVWVGWGFASENPILADKLAALSPPVVFIGPPASAMRALGDKIASTIVAQSAHVPCVSWSGDDITVDARDDQGRAYVPADVASRATTTSPAQGLEHAKRIGFPVMIKASEGGGGKGIRLVDSPEHFAAAFVQVQREVPGSPIFIMRVVRNARHLEVQLLADAYGNAIALFGRDCSVQRRHQKIIEEAPITIADQDMLDQMEAAAVRLAKMVGYVSAGTVEYLYEPNTKKFYFLELNPRLQVEHPTTEMVSGVNIPAAQLQIAMGIPLSCIRDIRILYGLTPNGTSDIDFDFTSPNAHQIQRKPSPKGHVIAARITAENPDAGFKPNSGKVLELNFRSNSNVWGYFSVNASGGVHEFADSQFGHIFSYGATRHDSRKNLVMALKELSIRGDFRTTVEYLVRLLETDDYVGNGVTTEWLDAIISANVEARKPDWALAALCGAVGKARAVFARSLAEYTRALDAGRTPDSALLTATTTLDFVYCNVQYRVSVALIGPEAFVVQIAGATAEVEVLTKDLADGGMLVLLGGDKHLLYIKEEPHATELTLDGKACLLETEKDPTKLRSPSPGKLVRFMVEDGAHLTAGDAYAEIEVMKMYMPLVSTESGTVRFSVPPGTVLQTGDVCGTLVLDDPSKVQKAAVFNGELPVVGPPQVIGEKPHQQYEHVKHVVENVLDGYHFSGDAFASVRRLVELLRDPLLPFHEISQILSSLTGRIPSTLDIAMRAQLESLCSGTTTDPANFSTATLLAHVESARTSLPTDEAAAFATQITPLLDAIRRYEGGIKGHERAVLVDLLERYAAVEDLFNGRRPEDVLLTLRETHRADIPRAVAIARAHSGTPARDELILCLLDQLRADSDDGKALFQAVVARLAHLRERSRVALKAKELLVYYQLPGYKERHADILETLRSAVLDVGEGEPPAFDYGKLTNLVAADHAILDVLPSFFFHSDAGVQATALYTYVHHTYLAYAITGVSHVIEANHPVFKWEFALRPVGGSKAATGGRNGLRADNRSPSSGSLSDMARVDSKVLQRGAICAFSSLAKMEAALPAILTCFGGALDQAEPAPAVSTRALRGTMLNVLNVALSDTSFDLAADDRAYISLARIVEALAPTLRAAHVRRVTFMIVRDSQFPRYFTFKETLGYTEDEIIRHIEPATTHQLELHRLAHYQVRPCFVDNRRLHVYHAVGKKNPADARFFVRAVVKPGRGANPPVAASHDFFLSEGDRILTDILDALEIVAPAYPNTDCNHLFIHFVPPVDLALETIEAAIQASIARHGARLWKLRVTTAEIRCTQSRPVPAPALSPSLDPARPQLQPARFVATNVTGYVTRVDVYKELRDATGSTKLQSLSSPPGPLHAHPVTEPYPTKEPIQPKRYRAHLMGTTYIYDFPELFSCAAERVWAKYAEAAGARCPAVFVKAKELGLGKGGGIEEVFIEPGSNTCGIVAWDMELFTPEYPEGRHIVVIANDITFSMGSFGPVEDLLFYRASEYARKLGIPRIYISANSGARIGLADEVLSRFRIAWTDPENPAKGFQYLFLSPSDHHKLTADKANPSVVAVRIDLPDGEVRYRIVDVIGRTHGLGVENLRGSGMIAGETSRAYEEIFTLSLVTCRSVGIGAYLVRLGQRAIQVEYTPIILTGAAALNKVLGRDVYSSNLQLGGTQIMHRNGVSHLVAKDDMAGVINILEWLSFVPKRQNAPLPVLPAADEVDRDIDVPLAKAGCDPRVLLGGGVGEEGEWMGGFFDRGSVVETLAGWAKGVVVARARLGGIPVGVISVETRSTESVIWADPADETSQERTTVEAGQVWYPNSAFKTAQAINDFNKGEQLPLIVFANWRGFSGGQSDMYREVLKFGAQIVDALRDYRQPVIVYVVGELRGGAWVVVDPTINPDMMEMYAEEDSRGGVLEPEGIVEIKYRRPQLLATLERLDPRYRELKSALAAATASSLEPAPNTASLQAAVEAREKELLPILHQSAIHFADLHDRAGRMQAKGVVRRVVPWRAARRFFYWRLLRRISEESVVSSLRAADPSLSRPDARDIVDRWHAEDAESDRGRTREAHDIDDDEEEDISVDGDVDERDVALVRWLDGSRDRVDRRIEAVRSDAARCQMRKLAGIDADGTIEELVRLVETLGPDARRKLLDRLGA
ncbi:acetyl-CoA carboxylase [Blyttiomyces helicus]|uniref:Acetyl-CoA carboxylase n=1 Tax=Blyttiomyces helicus TaxID=388810 RepID=A0A4P9WN74_9FUNG|nr:acetyl-CoA carboxylase [Blyttiomyces helicus]|eukprot:RKO93138.1 acetyl-CoA carboxylase [Blyttiomyces helicus]